MISTMNSGSPSHPASPCASLEDVPTCAGCGLEPEVVEYYRCKGCKTRVGFLCSCGTKVWHGIVVGMGILD